MSYLLCLGLKPMRFRSSAWDDNFTLNCKRNEKSTENGPKKYNKKGHAPLDKKAFPAKLLKVVTVEAAVF